MKRLLFALLIVAALAVTTAAQSNPPLVVKESDGLPRVTNPTQLIFPNGTLTRTGQTLTLTLAGGGDALVANPLSQFASTTSAQFFGVISNETGTGVVVGSASPTFTGAVAIPILNQSNYIQFTEVASPAAGAANTMRLYAVDDAGTTKLAYKDSTGTETFIGTGSGAPTDATYITQTANGSLSAEQALSALSTGIMRVATTTGVITSLTDSAGIAANISDETGIDALVFANTPTLVTPVLGVATATSINKVTITAPATSATLTIVDGATLTASASATVSGTNTGDQTAVSGNAGTATALETARTIGGVSFNGTANITVASATGGFTVSGGNLTLSTDLGTIFDEHASAPGTPASGTVILYAKQDGLLYSKDDAGTETLVSGGAGGGGSQTSWTANVDADGFNLLFDDATGIKSSEAGNPELVLFTSVASAVNEITITNAATGNAPIISATGGDTNIGITLTPKGTGDVLIGANHLLIQDGNFSAPGLAFASDTGTGFARSTAGVIEVRAGGSTMGLAANVVGTNVDGQFSWGSSAAAAGVVPSDTGLARKAAAVIRATNGGTGAGSVLIGTSAGAIGTSGVGVLAIENGTPPSSSPANLVQLYAEDVSTSSELKVRDEAANITVLSPHNFSLFDGPSEEMAWAFYSERNGKAINADMLRLIRRVELLTTYVEQLTGKKLNDHDLVRISNVTSKKENTNAAH